MCLTRGDDDSEKDTEGVSYSKSLDKKVCKNGFVLIIIKTNEHR